MAAAESSLPTHTHRVRYTVTATVRDDAVKDEYVKWLQSGHMAAVIEQGGALSAEINVLEQEVGGPIKLESTYIFASRAALQAYFDGAALSLRKEGVELWVETKKVAFERRIAAIEFNI